MHGATAACPQEPTDCDPRRATAGGYAARFRILNNIDIGDLPGGDGFLHGPEVTGSFVFDPKGNRSMLILDGQPGANMAAMREWVDGPPMGGRVDETASTRIVLLNQYEKDLIYVAHANGSIQDRSPNAKNCSASAPNPKCCAVKGLQVVPANGPTCRVANPAAYVLH